MSTTKFQTFLGALLASGCGYGSSTNGQVLTSRAGSGLPPNWQTSSGSGGVGAALAYAPSSGSVDPGTGISGFGSSIGRLKVTISANTTFAGLPAGADGQQLYIVVVAGNFTLTLTAGGSTAGAQMYGSTSYNLALKDCMPLFYDSGLSSWVLVP